MSGNTVRPLGDDFGELFGAIEAAGDKARLKQPKKGSLHASDLKGIERLLRNNPALARFPEGNRTTALHLAAHQRLPEVAKLLLQNGAEVNARNGLQQTPLHAALTREFGASGYALETVRTLVRHGADINAIDSEGYIPLSLAIKSGLDRVVQFLRKAGALLDLRSAIMLADAQAVRRLLATRVTELGHSPLPPDLLEEALSWMGIYLEPAEQAALQEIVRLLVAAGIDVNQRGRGGWAPIHTAALGGAPPATVRLLLEHGADVHAPFTSSLGRSFSEEVRDVGDSEIMDLLRRAGLDV